MLGKTGSLPGSFEVFINDVSGHHGFSTSSRSTDDVVVTFKPRLRQLPLVASQLSNPVCIWCIELCNVFREIRLRETCVENKVRQEGEHCT